jgi:hypothetical protein
MPETIVITVINFSTLYNVYIVTNMTIARQRFDNTRSRCNEQTRKSIVSQRLAKHTFRSNRETQTNRGTVRHSDVYSVRSKVMKELVQSSFSSEQSFESSVQFKSVQ